MRFYSQIIQTEAEAQQIFQTIQQLVMHAQGHHGTLFSHRPFDLHDTRKAILSVIVEMRELLVSKGIDIADPRNQEVKWMYEDTANLFKVNLNDEVVFLLNAHVPISGKVVEVEGDLFKIGDEWFMIRNDGRVTVTERDGYFVWSVPTGCGFRRLPIEKEFEPISLAAKTERLQHYFGLIADLRETIQQGVDHEQLKEHLLGKLQVFEA